MTVPSSTPDMDTPSDTQINAKENTMSQPTTQPKPITGLALFITNKAMTAHIRSPRRFTEGPATVSLWGWLWWNFVARR